MIKNPYDIEFEIEDFHWWFVVRRRVLKSILSTLLLPLNCVTLDIGCGAGSNLRELGGSRIRAIGVDQSIYALSLASKKLKAPLINGDLNLLPIRSESIGLIVAMDILEHLENDLNGIRELYRALQSGGILFLTVPAFGYLWGVQDRATGHKRRYSRKEISNKLRQEGFEILRSSYFNFFLFFPILFARCVIRLFGLRIESENKINSPCINFFLKIIFSLEPFLLRYVSFPLGVSIFSIAKK
ncbi:MAG: hypothetical protein A2157_05350 [Deltaproteobacteria bacterium RBG_16_47_11]|nr:MAG: hypothetical protein A2157_05350 [Deltaproteobacteria bacterium RBG_16_47_11]